MILSEKSKIFHEAMEEDERNRSEEEEQLEQLIDTMQPEKDPEISFQKKRAHR